MANRILRLALRDHAVTPAAAELHVAAAVERRTPTTELHGRLAGPRCLYASTVEVAYPFRPAPAPPDAPAAVAARVVVPEPSLWAPETPFLYRGAVELWDDGRPCDLADFVHGLRVLALGPRGLRVNGRLLTLRGREASRCDEAEAAALRRDGCNLLVAPAGGDAALWDLADRVGFLVLGRLGAADAADPNRLDALASRPSCLGWLIDAPGAVEWPAPRRGLAGRVGVRIDRPPPGPPPVGVHFLAGPADAAVALAAPGLPLLLLGPGPDAPGVFGRVE
jgi:hypothetical protein